MSLENWLGVAGSMYACSLLVALVSVPAAYFFTLPKKRIDSGGSKGDGGAGGAGGDGGRPGLGGEDGGGIMGGGDGVGGVTGGGLTT